MALDFEILSSAESLDWIIGSLRSTGMIDYWITLRHRRSLSHGRANALENMASLPILRGNGENNGDSLVPLLLRALGVCSSLALCVFVGEVIAYRVRKFLTCGL